MDVAIRETQFRLPGQVGEAYHGKVGDVYAVEHELGELLAVVRTDRISAFDVVLPQLTPHKGQVLNQMSAELLESTRKVAPNWLIESPDPNVTIGYKAKPYKIEMIMRGFLLGSSWKAYNASGVREICGNQLPNGMEEFQPFNMPLLTPTTKVEEGHDENISYAEILLSGLAKKRELRRMAELSFDLFAAGQAMAQEKGLLLADTKYEFGRLFTGEIGVIDEVHTPDSSRYFPLDRYNAYLAGETDERPKQLSKEFVREWLSAEGFNGEPDQQPPEMPQEFVQQVSNRYIDLYEQMSGRPFEPATATTEKDRLVAMQENVIIALENL